MNDEPRSRPPAPLPGQTEESDSAGRDRTRVPTVEIPMTTSFLTGSGSSAWEGPAVGMLIDGAYRVVGPLGQGAMGVVVLAIDERLEREVAIKFIRPAFVEQAQVRERFLDEARAMARVRHGNVVEIYAFGEIEGAPYFAMEYVAGSSVQLWLQDTVHCDGRPPLDEALGLLDQICRGLSAIHASGTVHGDLKPANVLIGPSFRAAIVDLGMARVLVGSGLGQAQSMAGTPGYMAPETLKAQASSRLAPCADIYSLAVMAFEMLTARKPFAGEGLADLLCAQEQAPIKPSALRDELTVEFDEVILNALHPDPGRRTADADRFRRELLRARESIASSGRALRILIANHEADFREPAAEALRRAFPGTKVEYACNGEEALRALELEPAALALVDLELPGMNGIELTATLRGTESSRAMPIIAVTGAGHAPEWTLLSSLGVDGFLVKPLDPYALIALARKVLHVADG